MTLDMNFATKLGNVDEAPATFRDAIDKHLPSRDSARLLAYSPSFTTLGHRSPATVLIVTGDGWLVAWDDADGVVHVDSCRFAETLLVELTTILLYGQLKLDFVVGDTTQRSIVHFDTVMGKLYHQAVGLILQAVDDGSERPTARRVDLPSVASETWSAYFREKIPENIANGQHLLATIEWPAVRGGFGRELAPAAILLATDREIVLLSNEKAWGGIKEAKYGTIATHFPLVRLESYHLHSHPRFAVLQLNMHASHGGEMLEILFPSDHANAVASVLERAMRAANGH
jgi:hypothetical protein